VDTQPASATPGPGPLGGAANEAGSRYRAGVAAYVAAHILRGQPFLDLDLLPEHAVPRSMVLEADEHVDDLAVELAGGGAALMQAKLHLDFGPSFKETVEQWKQVIRDRGVRPEVDRLVAACASASGTVHLLRSALRRRQRRTAGGALSGPERQALVKLEALIADLTSDQRDILLQTAVVWIADLRDLDGLPATLGQALLEPGVVALGEGATTWRLLRDHARDLAADRYGIGLEGLREFLDGQAVTLTAASTGYASARLEQRRWTVEAYRGRVVRRAERLDLRPLGVALDAIPLASMDGRVTVHAASRDAWDGGTIGGLPWALRRRGRALLLGLPGSGKSVALRTTAGFYAARATWPLPLHVPLGRLVQLLSVRDFRDALVDAALTLEPLHEQPALREAAIAALEEGDAVVLLDGLDEIRGERAAVLSGLADFLSEADPALEVLLSTRDSAYSDASQLGLAELRLARPDRPNDIARAILAAAGTTVPSSNRASWTEERRTWVRERLRRDSSLGETPLMVILLTLLAASAETDTLPTARAVVLRDVAMDVIARWEAGIRLAGETPEIGSLRGADAVRAGQEAFTVLGHVVFEQGEPPAQAAATAVAEMLVHRFGLAAAPAETAADAAIALWDEAGVFVLSQVPRRLLARVRLFSELAETLHVTAQDEAAAHDWLRRNAVEPDVRQPVLLACGLKAELADTLVDLVRTRPSDVALLDLTAEALREGARPSAASASALLDALLDRGPDVAPEAIAARTGLAVELPIVPAQQARAMTLFEDPHVTPIRRRLLRAMAVERWGREDVEVVDDLRAVTETEPEEVVGPRRREQGVIVARTVDAMYQRAMLIAARRLLRSGDVALAERLAPRISSGLAGEASRQLAGLLREHGFTALVENEHRRKLKRFGELPWQRDFTISDEEADDALLALIAGLAPPRRLLRTERRRLEALVDLVGTSGVQSAPFREARDGVVKDAARLRPVLRAIAERAGLDLPGLAAEARELVATLAAERDNRLDPTMMLGDGGLTLRMGPWDRVSEPESTAAALAEAIASPYAWISHLAGQALATVHGESATQAARVLRGLLPQTTGFPHEQVTSALGQVAAASQ
jgi:hypothetical protein